MDIMSLAPPATPLNLVALTKINFKEKSDCVQPNEMVMLESTIFVYFLFSSNKFCNMHPSATFDLTCIFPFQKSIVDRGKTKNTKNRVAKHTQWLQHVRVNHPSGKLS